MTSRRYVAICVVIHIAASGCAAIAGFEDFHRECPASTPDCAAGGKSGGGGAGKGGTSRGGSASGGHAGMAAAGGDAATSGAGGTSGVSAGGSAGGGRAGAAASDSGATPSIECVDATAAARKGSAMARVVRMDGSSFLIDLTEVTNGQYAEFLAKPSPSVNPLCTGAPKPPSGDCAELRDAAAGSDAADRPRVCVDWCDAEAYCKWAGKELCPDTDKSTDLARSNLLLHSDFYAACSENSAESGPIYGCGPGCASTDCNGMDAQHGAVVPVGTTPTCRVGPAACPITDLSGNVDEWTDGCDLNTSDGNCLVRGGSFDSPASNLECDAKKLLQRRSAWTTVGFRCCVDP